MLPALLRQPEGIAPPILQKLEADPKLLDSRLEDVITFNSLGKEEIKHIVEIQMVNVRKRLGEKRIDLKLTENAKKLLADEGFDPAYGARPLKRAIQRMALDPLAVRILKGEFREGDTIEVGSTDGQINFRKVSVANGR